MGDYRPVSLEDLVLAYMERARGGGHAPPLMPPARKLGVARVIRFTLSRFWPQAALAAGLLVVIAAALAVTGSHLYQLWDTVLAPCLAAHPDIARYGPGPNYGPGYPGACRAAFTLRADYAPYEWMRDAASIAVLVVPALIGLFWGRR